jgi:hypothetical protein
VVQLLVSEGADKEKARSNGATPLFLACHKGQLDVVQLLVSEGADKETARSDGFTPLLMACQEGHLNVVQLLVSEGTNVNARDHTQFTALHIAAENGHTDVCRLLLDNNADVNVQGHNQVAPLHLAAKNNNNEVCMVLAHKGGDLSALDAFHRRPADYAASCHTLAAHLQDSGSGVHYLNCPGPSLEPRLVWNDTAQQQQEAMLDEMQGQWLTKVKEGCAQARVGLTLQLVCQGRLSPSILVQVLGFAFGETHAHSLACVSTKKIAMNTLAVCVAQQDGGASMQDGGCPPRLMLVSHELALLVTPPPYIPSPATEQQREAIAQLTMEDGCPWLSGYCGFLLRRHPAPGSQGGDVPACGPRPAAAEV